jgi:2-polyprenyl-3-methyl-5-hydroxy-6-metoxy-1,4-benzoquinol methylase
MAPIGPSGLSPLPRAQPKVVLMKTGLKKQGTAGRESTRDPVNQNVLDVRDEAGLARLGLMTNQVWHDDPKRLVFTLARYKFVAKMLSGRGRVLEIGCGDGFASRIVQQEVGHLTVSDFDPLFVADAQARATKRWPADAVVLDILAGPPAGSFDAAYSLDVLEHIPAEREDMFLSNVAAALDEHGVLIVGMPSLESQPHASPPSRAGHVNCKRGSDLKKTLERHFRNVFMFSMNDEVVHTGFFPMAHYLLAVCCSKR